jgi:hypothetical protein
MPKMVFETNLRLLQGWANDSAQLILSRLDKSLVSSVSFVAIYPNILVGSPSVQPSDIADNIQVFGAADLSLLEQAFPYFRGKLEEYEVALGAQEKPPLPPPLNWREQPVLKGVAIGYALEAAFNEADASGGYVYFTDRAVWRDEDRHFVCPVLRLNRAAYESHYRLDSPITLNPASTSLLDLTVNQLLQACIEGLRAPSADELHAFSSYARNVLTDSASAIMNFGRPMYFYLFSDCNAIAALPYEGRGGAGKMLIAERQHPNVEPKIIFKSPIRLSDHRMSRKALEMAREDLCLLCDGSRIYGLGVATGDYDSANQDLFVVEFTKQHSWRLWHDTHELMTVTLGKPSLPAKRISEGAFDEHFRRSFDKVKGIDSKSIYKLVEAAAAQDHGALLVVSEIAEAEAKRLGGQVEPFALIDERVRSLTAIDGAVVIDPTGMCHGVGVILDGQAVESWDPSRGSRYNSAMRYVSTKRDEGHKCMAVVISEDGMTNLL